MRDVKFILCLKVLSPLLGHILLLFNKTYKIIMSEKPKRRSWVSDSDSSSSDEDELMIIPGTERLSK